MIVVFDTNVWLSQLGLRNAAASGVRFFLKQNNYRVALPEVVRMEVTVNLQTDLMRFIDEMKASHEQLLTVFQKLPKIALPSEAEVRALIPDLFASIGVQLIEVPFSIESAKSSFLKTIHKVAPSNNNQQFKDGVLWADCLALLDTDDVTLVTADKAFYAGHSYDKGLASNLKIEASGYPHRLCIVENLTTLLNSLPKNIPFNEDAFVKAALVAAESNITYYLDNEFELGTPSRINRKLFATENTAKLFFEGSIEIPCPDISGMNRKDGLLTIDATGLYYWEMELCETIDIQQTTFKFFSENGDELERKGVWLRSSNIGGRQVTSIIRHELHEP